MEIKGEDIKEKEEQGGKDKEKAENEDIEDDLDEKIFNQSNKLNIPYMVIDQNIKKDKMKENRQIKELLLSRLKGIDEQVNKLMENEKEIKIKI